MTTSQQRTPAASTQTEPVTTSGLRTPGNARWGVWALAIAFAGLGWSVLSAVVPRLGWLSGLAVLAGAIAYAMMATNLFLAIRRPVLEKLFGPLDRVYHAHRLIGTGIVAALGLHLVLIPIASLADRGQSILAHLTVALPLGVTGALLLVASIILAASTKVPYGKWQKVHLATGLAFLLLTGHMLTAANLWFSLGNASGVILGGFALLGVGSFVLRIAARIRAGTPYTITETIPRERGLEIIMRPEGTRHLASHQPGQFIFLTATAGGASETHPFTLTSPAGDECLSVLIRPSGDWTAQVQATLAAGDRVLLEGPFGAFTPQAGPGAPQHQVWVAGGAGITPFLSVLRTAHRDRNSHDPGRVLGGGMAAPGTQPGEQVELVLAARDACDVPCWDELSALAGTMRGLTLTPAFSDQGGRLDSDAIDQLAARKPAGTAWYLCGPARLADMVQRTLQRRTPASSQVHRELYEWRSSPSKKTRRTAGAAVGATARGH